MGIGYNYSTITVYHRILRYKFLTSRGATEYIALIYYHFNIVVPVDTFRITVFLTTLILHVAVTCPVRGSGYLSTPLAPIHCTQTYLPQFPELQKLSKPSFRT